MGEAAGSLRAADAKLALKTVAPKVTFFKKSIEELDKIWRQFSGVS